MTRAVRLVWVVADLHAGVPGGMRRHMELHARGLRQLGVSAAVVYADEATRTGISAIDARTSGARLLAGTLQRIRSERPDVINVHTLAAPAFILAKRSGLIGSRIVVMSYAADERSLAFSPADRRAFLRRLRVKISARSFPLASGVWCVARQDAEFYEQHYAVPTNRVRFIPHAIEDAFFAPDQTSRKRDQLLFVGTWIHRKGIDVLKQALATVIRERPETSIVIAGTLAPDSDVRSYLSLPASTNLRTMSRLADDELRHLYHESTLLVLPSRLEGMPFALLEAMACGCPVVAAANSGMLDAVLDGQNGWLVDHFDGERWGGRILELLTHPAELAAASVASTYRAEGYRLGPLSREALSWYESIDP